MWVCSLLQKCPLPQFWEREMTCCKGQVSYNTKDHVLDIWIYCSIITIPNKTNNESPLKPEMSGTLNMTHRWKGWTPMRCCEALLSKRSLHFQLLLWQTTLNQFISYTCTGNWKSARKFWQRLEVFDVLIRDRHTDREIERKGVRDRLKSFQQHNRGCDLHLSVITEINLSQFQKELATS